MSDWADSKNSDPIGDWRKTLEDDALRQFSQFKPVMPLSLVRRGIDQGVMTMVDAESLFEIFDDIGFMAEVYRER